MRNKRKNMIRMRMKMNKDKMEERKENQAIVENEFKFK